MSQMSQKLRQGVFDELTLRVNPKSTDPCRQIVPKDPNNACYVSANGALYEDDTWKVQLVTMSIPFSGQQQYRVRVDYKGWNALPGTRCHNCARAFDTGVISLSVVDCRCNDGSVSSKIEVSTTYYSDLLSDNFGIWDSYFLGSPNDSYSANRGDDFSMAIVSDGEVTCWLGNEQIKNPGLECLAMTLRADESYYEVSGATWVVIIRLNKYGESEAQIELRTEECDFEKLFVSLERYLEEMELARFDDLLDVVLE